MEKKIKILIAEDDPNLGKLIETFLKAKGFECDLAIDGEQALDFYRKNEYQFLVLDVMMPKKDGFTLAKDIRAIDKEVPIIFLTAKSMKEDRLEGFEIGADDYITKPFAMEELIARINAIMKRVGGEDDDYSLEGEIQLNKNATINFDKRILSISGEETKLTTRENQLLKILYKNKNQVLDRNATLIAVWGDDSYFNGRSMDVYITKLRKHLKPISEIEIINIHGKGFKFLHTYKG